MILLQRITSHSGEEKFILFVEIPLIFLSHLQVKQMDSPTMDITLCSFFFFIIMWHLKHWKHCKAQSVTYDVTTETLANLDDVCSLACKMKVWNGHVLGTWKWAYDED